MSTLRVRVESGTIAEINLLYLNNKSTVNINGIKINIVYFSIMTTLKGNLRFFISENIAYYFKFRQKLTYAILNILIIVIITLYIVSIAIFGNCYVVSSFRLFIVE